jgi:hypothetical protein
VAIRPLGDRHHAEVARHDDPEPSNIDRHCLPWWCMFTSQNARPSFQETFAIATPRVTSIFQPPTFDQPAPALVLWIKKKTSRAFASRTVDMGYGGDRIPPERLPVRAFGATSSTVDRSRRLAPRRSLRDSTLAVVITFVAAHSFDRTFAVAAPRMTSIFQQPNL